MVWRSIVQALHLYTMRQPCWWSKLSGTVLLIFF
jgi:hypothetical protein